MADSLVLAVRQWYAEEMLTDADIMARVQAGDREIFGLLVTRYSPRLLSVAHSKLGDAVLAEDLVQETFLAAYGARATYNTKFAVSTWLWTILLNLCRRHWKRSRTRSRLEGKSESTAPAEDQTADALSGLIHAEERRQVHELLAELPDSQADALRLRFFGGLPFEEIAQAMDCSLSGAKRRVKTGLERLTTRIRSLEDSDSSDKVGLQKEEQV